jgi:hypothetical protein
MQNKGTAFPNRIRFFHMKKRKERAVPVILLHSRGTRSLGFVFHCPENRAQTDANDPTNVYSVVNIGQLFIAYAYVFFDRFFRILHHIYVR